MSYIYSRSLQIILYSLGFLSLSSNVSIPCALSKVPHLPKSSVYQLVPGSVRRNVFDIQKTSFDVVKLVICIGLTHDRLMEQAALSTCRRPVFTDMCHLEIYAVLRQDGLAMIQTWRGYSLLSRLPGVTVSVLRH